MNIGRPAPQRLDIRPGQVQHLQLAAGTVLYLRRGHALLREAPQWLGDSLHSMTRRLNAGQSHVLTQSGWQQLQADDEAVVVELPRLPDRTLGPESSPSHGRSDWRASIGRT